jgi:CheY-like chemotaxis protein
MKILVIEDKEMHRTAAAETLAGHELTIVESFDEGIKAMSTEVDHKKLERLKIETNFPEYPRGEGATDKDREAWDAKLRELEDRTRPRPQFEAVLTDMNMPMSRQTLAPGVYEWKTEVPYGFILALRASQIGAKHVAMVTDTNHHQGAMSAAIDHLGGAYYRGTEEPFEINGAKVLFLHAPFVEDTIKDAPCDTCKENPGVCALCKGTGKSVHSHKPCNLCSDGKCHHCKGTTKADKAVHERKDWGRALAHLMGGSSVRVAAK